MKALLVALTLVLPGGDREEGVRLYEQGRYAEAAAAFRRALEAEGPSAELSYNLALSLWRAGELEEAQTAVEEMAVVAGDEHDARRYGLLGALRYEDAQSLREQAHAGQDPAATQKLELLGQALQKARNARNHFARAGSAPGATPALARNLERALRLIEELEKEIEEAEQEQQQQQQQQQQQDQRQQDRQQDQQQQQDQPPEDPRQQEQQQEPTPAEEQQQDQQQQDQQQQDPEQQDQQQRQDAPGEQAEERNLSPEEKRRLLEQLQEIEQLLQRIRAQQGSRRVRVEKDW